MKMQILAAIGEKELQPVTLLNAALAANDRVKFGFSLLQSVLLYLIEHRLLGIRGFHLMWLHELLRAAVNTLVAVPVFLLLDRTKHPE